jgi:hypothetical protein
LTPSFGQTNLRFHDLVIVLFSKFSSSTGDQKTKRG